LDLQLPFKDNIVSVFGVSVLVFQFLPFRFQLSTLGFFSVSAFRCFSFLPMSRLLPEFQQRLKSFAALVIRLYMGLPKAREEVRVLGKQLLRSATSVAAHGREAGRARSDDEFASKIGGALQETDESLLWLELLREECSIAPAQTGPLEKECNELIAIFVTMITRTRAHQPR
jgi:four helix bundle protein